MAGSSVNNAVATVSGHVYGTPALDLSDGGTPRCRFVVMPKRGDRIDVEARGPLAGPCARLLKPGAYVIVVGYLETRGGRLRVRAADVGRGVIDPWEHGRSDRPEQEPEADTEEAS
jgi:hypothetical protein